MSRILERTLTPPSAEPRDMRFVRNVPATAPLDGQASMAATTAAAWATPKASMASTLTAAATPGIASTGHVGSRRPRSRISIVVLTYNRVESVLHTLARLCALSDAPPVIVVDNGSTDDTVTRIRHSYPEVSVVCVIHNAGACARNAGVARANSDYVAFCDDDTWWDDGALQRAVRILDAHPRVAILSARVLVGASDAEDATCQLMAESPLASTGLPGPALVGYMAGASVHRVSAFRQAGGYDPRFFIGGEEELLALDLLSAGWSIVYAHELVVRHHPSPLRDAGRRRQLLARNAIWAAWLRLPARLAWTRTLPQLMRMVRRGKPLADLADTLAGLRWVLAERRIVPAHVCAALTTVAQAERFRRRERRL
ncbi:MAG: glycosyltransferase family 2 protein [Janthinobacterium lividum]